VAGPPEPLSPVHATQAPALHTGVVPKHWALDRHAVHVFVVRSQKGVAPPQFASLRQATQTPLKGLQNGVAGAH
jgi:hypothetical protein